MGTKLYVGNLNYNTNEESLREAFGANGREVASVSIIMDRETGRSRGFAFVEMATPEGAQQAMEKIDSSLVDNKLIFPDESDLKGTFDFMALTEAQNKQYEGDWSDVTGG